MAALDRAVDASVRLIAGISLGAHAAVRWAASNRRKARRLDGLWLVLPAWTGEADAVAALSSTAADEVAAEGLRPPWPGLAPRAGSARSSPGPGPPTARRG